MSGRSREGMVPRGSKPPRAEQPQRFEASFWAGLTPSPEDCAKYEVLVPGATTFFLKEAGKQTDHRMHLERSVIESNIFMAKVGLFCGTTIVLCMLILAGFAIVHGQGGEGVLLACASLFGVTGTFVWGQYRQERERRIKAREAQAKLPQHSGRR